MSDTTIIDLLRHGEVEKGNVFCGSTDVMLSDAGWAQMQKTLENEASWDRVVTSPLQRCHEFAESLSSQEDLDLNSNASFQEIDFGDWEGCEPAEILKEDGAELNAWWKAPTRRVPPNGEAFQDFRSRVLKAFNQLTVEHQGEHILLVTHAGVIRVLIMHILGMQDENLFRLDVGYASLTKLRIYHDDAGDWGTLISHG